MTARPDEPASAMPASRWADLPTPAQAKQWEAVKPGTIDRILDAVEQAERHDQRMQWAELGLRLFGTLAGLGSVVVLALVAKYFVDHGAATQGAGIFGLGAASMVAAFLTHRRRGGE